MSLSRVRICNQALTRVSGTPITAFEDAITIKSKEAIFCVENYEDIRDEVLSAADWTFATERFVRSDPDTSTPTIGWGNKFLIPANVLRVSAVSNRQDVEDLRQYPVAWERKGNYIFVRDQVVVFDAVIREENTAIYDPMFVQCLVTRLAMQAAIPIAKNRNLRKELEESYEDLLTDASGSEGRQGSRQQIISRRLVTARRAGYASQSFTEG